MILEGRTVRLRPLSLDDLDSAMQWVNDPEVTRTLLTGRYPTTREAERKWFEEHVDINTREACYAIETLAGEYLGGASLFRIVPVERTAELGIVIGRKTEWGKRYAAEAMQLLLDYGFRELNLHLIYLHVYADHSRAVRLYEKLGFTTEGCLRDRVFRDGRYHDFLAMSIRRSEWEIRRGAP